MNYRLALTLNSLVLTTADSATSIDSSVNIQLANGSFLNAANIRTGVQQLIGINAKPLTADGFYGGLIHPTVVHDVLNDTSANGLTDILKRNESMVDMLFKAPSNDEAISFGGAKFKQTTTLSTATISSNTYYQTYLFGEDAIFSVFLGKNPETKEKNYSLRIQVAPANGSVSDPSRLIGGWVAYNTRYTNTLRPGSTMTIRRFQSETSSS